MYIKLSEAAEVECNALANIVGCSLDAIVTAILRRGFSAVTTEAQQRRANDDYPWGSDGKLPAMRKGPVQEPSAEHWRAALDL